MYRRILVPVDGSDAAGLGLAEAARLARSLGATLRVVHVVDDELAFAAPEFAMHSIERLGRMRAHGREIVEQALAAARASGATAEGACLDVIGEPAGAAIAAEARRSAADLIVLGTHGRRGIRRLVLGSDAEHVVRTATVPVLVVRVGAPRP
jgi:nucleotide-binding universal stress UspA family protein